MGKETNCRFSEICHFRKIVTTEKDCPKPQKTLDCWRKNVFEIAEEMTLADCDKGETINPDVLLKNIEIVTFSQDIQGRTPFLGKNPTTTGPESHAEVAIYVAYEKR